MLVYAATIVVSAFLLFQVQPLIGKIVLPWFGGSTAVWSAVLMFFQVGLLAGYAYAHFSIRRFRRQTQILVHLSLLAASVVLLPILPSPTWKPTTAADPTARILALLAVAVGLPYFLLSSTSPLLQAWYVRRMGGRTPYRLFALSNAGSLLGLLCFPLWVEPNFTSRQQAHGWGGIYVGFVLLCAVVAFMSWERPGRAAVSTAAPQAASPPAGPTGRPRWTDLAMWVGLAATASTLLMAVTTHLTHDVAPIPLLWVVPLAVYLITFILAFESDRIYRRRIFLPPLPLALGVMAYLLQPRRPSVSVGLVIPAFVCGLFVCCMMCHGELARRKPGPAHLTLFYLIVALGGALGGLFVALVAPRMFASYLELPIALVGCALLASVALRDVHLPERPWLRWGAALRLLPVWFLAGYLGHQYLPGHHSYYLRTRNFHGMLSVSDHTGGLPERSVRSLVSGTINHGSQFLHEQFRYRPTTYYGEASGVGRAIRALKENRDQIRVGVVGLGAGVLSTYAETGDDYTFYEINPEVKRIALTEFSFYRKALADKRILLGDARLTLERQERQRFDLLAVDAFSGDAIPVHLLTREALAHYFRHLKPDGILALHVTNRYLNLVPVCARGAETFHKQAVTVRDEGEGPNLSSSTWVLVTANRDGRLFNSQAFSGANMSAAKAPPGFRGWTDDYSNLIASRF